jgi:RND family efflux transporter MFP subunit
MCVRTFGFGWVALVALVAIVAPAPSFAQPGGPSPVVVSPAVEREVHSGQTFVATVMPLKRSAVGSAVDGRVVEFPLNEGDRVAAGEPLAQLLTETIRLEHEAALAQLELYRQELAELEAGTRKEEKDRARAQMEAAKALAEYARSKYDRTRALYEQRRAVSEIELEEALSGHASAQQTYLAAKAAYDLAEAGPRPETIAQARAKVESQRAVAERLEDQKKKHTIVSPFDGYVSAEHTEVGQWVNRGDLVAEVVHLDQVDVRAFVLEQHVPYIRPGLPVRVEVPALPSEVFTGQVALVVPQADERSRTFPVKIRVDNKISEEEGPLLKAGLLARVTLPTGAKEIATLVPKDALVLGGPQPMVYVVDLGKNGAKQGKVRPVPVQLGVADGALIQVKGELKNGQQVVVRGNERLRPGQDVLITDAITPGNSAATAALR